ncbi:MAG: YkgJ family cysteine cluster protein [Treponemataceae bacterium]|nr:YkgJ family cysteine cluster protein [Treponemataceae bacterium]
MSEKFYQNGLHFECKQCSHCCCDEPGFVYLSREDLTRLTKLLNLTDKEFIKQFCRFVPFYDGSEVLCLKEKENYDCIFQNKGCSVYKARPVQCSTYPFWSFIIKNRDSWENESKECPGINKGRIHSKEEIEEATFLYEKNIPLRKCDFF